MTKRNSNTCTRWYDTFHPTLWLCRIVFYVLLLLAIGLTLSCGSHPTPLNMWLSTLLWAGVFYCTLMWEIGTLSDRQERLSGFLLDYSKLQTALMAKLLDHHYSENTPPKENPK